MKYTNQYQTETVLIFLLNATNIQSGDYNRIAIWIAVAGGEPGQKCCLTEDLMLFCSWPHVSCSASGKQIKQGCMLGALLSTGAGPHGPSLTCYCWAAALLLTPGDASGYSFNQSDSKTVQKHTVMTVPWEMHCRHLKLGRELEVVFPIAELVLRRRVPPPYWHCCLKDSALPTEQDCGLWSLLGIMHCPGMGSVAVERSKGLDASVCSMPPVSSSCTSPVHNLHNFLCLYSCIWYHYHPWVCHMVFSNVITAS